MHIKNNNNIIGIFDSGVGGLSVVFETQKTSPSTDIVYIADTLYQPYGEKTEQEVIDRSRAIIEKFISLNIYKIIIACSTATAVALKTLQKEYRNVQINGIITDSFISHTIENSITKNIGIIATPLTTKSKTFEIAIKNANSSYNIYTKATPKIVNIISEGIPDKNILIKQIKSDVDTLIKKDIDTLILGCTHFSLIKDLIKSIYPSLHVVSPPYFTAHQLAKTDVTTNIEGKSLFYTTYLPNEFIETTKQITGRIIEASHIKIIFTDKHILTK